MKYVAFIGTNDTLDKVLDIASDCAVNGFILKYFASDEVRDPAIKEIYSVHGRGDEIINCSEVAKEDWLSSILSNNFPTWDGLSLDIRKHMVNELSKLSGLKNHSSTTLVIKIGVAASQVETLFLKLRENPDRCPALLSDIIVLDVDSSDFDILALEYIHGKIPPEKRIKNALMEATSHSQVDGGHHKAWSIDVMVRALCGDPFPQLQQNNSEYDEFIKKACDGEDGPDTYSWDEGTPP